MPCYTYIPANHTLITKVGYVVKGISSPIDFCSSHAIDCCADYIHPIVTVVEAIVEECSITGWIVAVSVLSFLLLICVLTGGVYLGRSRRHHHLETQTPAQVPTSSGNGNPVPDNDYESRSRSSDFVNTSNTGTTHSDHLSSLASSASVAVPDYRRLWSEIGFGQISDPKMNRFPLPAGSAPPSYSTMTFPYASMTNNNNSDSGMTSTTTTPTSW